MRRMGRVTALTVAICAGAWWTAAAQTVIVTSAPAGSAVELILNQARVASTAADVDGIATLTAAEDMRVDEAGVVARLFVDVCADTRRVLIVEPALSAPSPGAGCTRRDVGPRFVVRPITTFAIDLAGTEPLVRVRQGRAPEAWLRNPSDPATVVQNVVPSPAFVVSGGGGLHRFGGVIEQQCGNVTACTGTEARRTFTLGGAYWFTPNLGASVNYGRPDAATVAGSGDTFQFDTALRAHVFNVAGLIGGPVGIARLYGLAGATYHRARSTIEQTIDDVTIPPGDDSAGNPVVIRGGTQTLELETTGWGLLFGGGAEVWVSRRVAIYGELTWPALKGSDVDGGEGRLDHTTNFLALGVRLNLMR